MISRLLMSRVPRVLQHQFNSFALCETLKKFGAHRFYATTVKLKIDSQNVVSSGLSDIKNFDNIYLHDLIWENIHRWSNKTALVCSATGRLYTYSQLRKACGRLATTLRKSNLLPGDNVAIVLPNIPEFVIILLAANEAGLTACLINPAQTKYEIKNQITSSDIKAVFTISAKYADVQASIENNPMIKLPIIVVDNDTSTSAIPGTIKFNDLIREDTEEFSLKQKPGVDFKDRAVLCYSSGTTGLSKGVELTHRNIVANILQAAHPSVFSGIETGPYHQEVIPIILPMYHCYALVLCVYSYLRIGAKLVCMPQFSIKEFIKLLENYQSTILYVVPPIVQMMAYNDQITSRHIEAMRCIITGAAPIGPESISIFKNRISDKIVLVQGYGLTETSPVISYSRNAPAESCGYLLSNLQLRIVGRNNENLGIREIGELYVRGPNVMKGYYKNPEATANAMEGDWLKTGDLGYYTEDGLLYVQGRLKELIKVKGYQVSPIELEEVIRAYNKIQDVAVIGVDHDKYGEIPKAFIVPKPGMEVNEEELKAFVAERVTKYKQLGYVQIVENIPKSAAGKILRKKLKKI